MGIITKKAVELAIAEVRSFILSDGGDISVVAIKDKQIFIKLQGACQACPLSFYTLSFGVERALKDRFGEEVTVVQVEEQR